MAYFDQPTVQILKICNYLSIRLRKTVNMNIGEAGTGEVLLFLPTNDKVINSFSVYKIIA